jgi:hypothetical protein
VPPVDGPAWLGHEDLPDAGDGGMTDRLSDEETAEAPAAGRGSHEYVTKPGDSRLVGDEAGVADLGAIRRVQPDRERVPQGTLGHVMRLAGGPVALLAEPPIHQGDVNQVLLVAHPVTIWPGHSHQSPPLLSSRSR